MTYSIKDIIAFQCSWETATILLSFFVFFLACLCFLRCEYSAELSSLLLSSSDDDDDDEYLTGFFGFLGFMECL